MVGLSCFSLSIIDKLRLATRRKMPLGVFIYIYGEIHDSINHDNVIVTILHVCTYR